MALWSIDTYAALHLRHGPPGPPPEERGPE
jgi:hypothetical protein